MTDNEESNLVIHARKELGKIGEEADTVEGYLKVIQAFSDMGHSGGSAGIGIAVLSRLMSYKPLSPLTNDPSEWNHVGADVWGEEGGVWQNNRDGEAFSHDGGKTYYLLSERVRDENDRLVPGLTHVAHNFEGTSGGADT